MAQQTAPVRVALDAMGGDHAPSVVVEGAVRALREAGGALHVLLVGPERAVRDTLAAHDTAGLALDVVDAPEVIAMDESPSSVLKGKPGSSIHRGLGLVREGHADAFASAGNTGAVMAASLFLLGRVPGVQRPALPGYIPTLSGTCLVLDVGANLEVRPEHLVQFAQMGRIYARLRFGMDDPAVGLVNVGEEPGKGTDVLKAAHTRLAELAEAGAFRFAGNIEGRDILTHGADVVVCDGFVGNVVLKLAESVAGVLPALVRGEIARQALGEDEAGLIVRVLRGMLEPFNYENFGGVPLLGVQGTSVIGHGGSSARAIEQMVLRAAECARDDVPGRIAEALAADAAQPEGAA